MDADLVLTFLVIMQVSWLPIGTAWGVLSLVRAVVAGCQLPVQLPHEGLLEQHCGSSIGGSAVRL
ncbi:hypothetical protein [Streptomyces sp. NPDC055287]